MASERRKQTQLEAKNDTRGVYKVMVILRNG